MKNLLILIVYRNFFEKKNYDSKLFIVTIK